MSPRTLPSKYVFGRFASIISPAYPAFASISATGAPRASTAMSNRRHSRATPVSGARIPCNCHATASHSGLSFLEVNDR